MVRSLPRKHLGLLTNIRRKNSIIRGMQGSIDRSYAYGCDNGIEKITYDVF